MRDILTKVGILFDHLRVTFDAWKRAIWNRDLDQRYCCDGQECGCMGATVREVYTMKSKSRE